MKEDTKRGNERGSEREQGGGNLGVGAETASYGSLQRRTSVRIRAVSFQAA